MDHDFYIAKCMSCGTSNFAEHHIDKIEAAKYLQACLDSNIQTSEVQDAVKTYLKKNGRSQEFIQKQMLLIGSLFSAWLSDDCAEDDSNVRHI